MMTFPISAKIKNGNPITNQPYPADLQASAFGSGSFAGVDAPGKQPPSQDFKMIFGYRSKTIRHKL